MPCVRVTPGISVAAAQYARARAPDADGEATLSMSPVRLAQVARRAHPRHSGRSPGGLADGPDAGAGVTERLRSARLTSSPPI